MGLGQADCPPTGSDVFFRRPDAGMLPAVKCFFVSVVNNVEMPVRADGKTYSDGTGVAGCRSMETVSGQGGCAEFNPYNVELSAEWAGVKLKAV